ncbi:MAG: DinB family protein [Rhodothermales bacterium]
MEPNENPSDPRSSQLRDYARRFEAVKGEARTLVAGLDEAAFNWRHDPEHWSVAECLDHLNTAGRLLLPKLDEAIRRGRARKMERDGPFDYGWLGRWWIEAMQPSSRRRFKVPKAFEPSSSSLAKEEVLATFLALQDSLVQRVHEADGLDLRRVKAPSAAFPLIRLPLGVWFESTAAHERRHLAQARRVMAHIDFPAP